MVSFSPVLWTNNNQTVIAAFEFTADSESELGVYDTAKTTYEFDAITLETVGAPFEGHTKTIGGLALSFDHALLASTSYDDTIKLWAFQSRQLLASVDIPNLSRLVLSPNSHQLAYTVYTAGDCKICICDTPPDVLAQARVRILLKHLLFVC
jgi:WD40 repeat protein